MQPANCPLPASGSAPGSARYAGFDTVPRWLAGANRPRLAEAIRSNPTRGRRGNRLERSRQLVAHSAWSPGCRYTLGVAIRSCGPDREQGTDRGRRLRGSAGFARPRLPGNANFPPATGREPERSARTGCPGSREAGAPGMDAASRRVRNDSAARTFVRRAGARAGSPRRSARAPVFPATDTCSSAPVRHPTPDRPPGTRGSCPRSSSRSGPLPLLLPGLRTSGAPGWPASRRPSDGW